MSLHIRDVLTVLETYSKYTRDDLNRKMEKKTLHKNKKLGALLEEVLRVNPRLLIKGDIQCQIEIDIKVMVRAIQQILMKGEMEEIQLKISLSSQLKQIELEEKSLEAKVNETETVIKETQKDLESLKIKQTKLNEKKTQYQADLENLKKKKEVFKKKGTVSNKNDATEDNSCKICYEPFDSNLHHLSCITKCFHTFCHSCLISLDPKNCPNCRKPFTVEEIRKLY